MASAKPFKASSFCKPAPPSERIREMYSMAASSSVAAAALRGAAGRDGDCSILSSAAFIRGPCTLKGLRRGPSSRIVQMRRSNRDTRQTLRGNRNLRIVWASGDDIPSELLEEDSNFVKINELDSRFGPPAILLVGFTNGEAIKVQDLLKNMEGDFMQVLLCTDEMGRGTLGNAFDAVQPNLMEIQVAKGLPRISFISGLTGEEIMMLINIFPEAGVERTVFAGHVPLNSDKPMAELFEEIMGDHRRLSNQTEAVET